MAFSKISWPHLRHHRLGAASALQPRGNVASAAEQLAGLSHNDRNGDRIMGIMGCCNGWFMLTKSDAYGWLWIIDGYGWLPSGKCLHNYGKIHHF